MLFRAIFIISLFFLCSLLGLAQNNVCFEIEANPYPNDAALSGFTKYVNVYGFEVFGENGVSDAQVLHAAAVSAELLDNDEDGVVDDQPLHTQLTGSGALMPIFNDEGSPMENTFFDNYSGLGVSAVLYATEIDPTQTGIWGYDASVEEILHTINHVGHSEIHPAIFGFDPNSSEMTAAMDVARGGHWLSIPNPYPAQAWYHYDDQTCDYGCMAIEYIYWCIVSNMGILNDPLTCSGIANEWEPCSPTMFQNTDVAMYNLITNPMYKIPQNAPDGNYCPAETGVSLNENQVISAYPIPVQDVLKVELRTTQLIRITNLEGRILERFSGTVGLNLFDLSGLKKGVYVLQSEEGFTQKIVR